MKNVIVPAIAAMAMLFGSTVAHAGGYCSGPAKRIVVTKKTVCKPTCVCTRVISSRTECCWYMDSCGRRQSYEVKIVSLVDYYSDGSEVRYTRSVPV